MSSTMLQLVVTNELGVSTPTTVASNTNQDVIQILALMNAAGYEFLRKHDWRQLTKQYTFTTVYTQTTGNVTLNTYTITGIPSTAGLDSTYQVVGNGISNACYIESVDSATQVTVNLPSTGTYTGATITFEKVKYALPSDYESTVPRTHWDKSKHWEMLGPESAQQWEWLLLSQPAHGFATDFLANTSRFGLAFQPMNCLAMNIGQTVGHCRTQAL